MSEDLGEVSNTGSVKHELFFPIDVLYVYTNFQLQEQFPFLSVFDTILKQKLLVLELIPSFHKLMMISKSIAKRKLKFMIYEKKKQPDKAFSSSRSALALNHEDEFRGGRFYSRTIPNASCPGV